MISLCYILTYTYSRLVLQDSAIKVIMTIYLSITSTGINNTSIHYISSPFSEHARYRLCGVVVPRPEGQGGEFAI